MKRFASNNTAVLCAALLVGMWAGVANASDAFRLQGVQLEPGTAGPVVQLSVDGTSAYRVSGNSQCTTLHIDLADTLPAEDMNHALVDASGAVKNVSSRVLSETPQAVTRITVELTRPYSFTANSDDTLTLQLTAIESDAALKAFRADAAPIRLAEERTMAQSYVRAVARATDAQWLPVLSATENDLTLGKALLEDTRQGVLAMELAASNAHVEDIRNTLAKVGAQLDEQSVQFQSSTAKFAHTLRSTLDDIASADAQTARTLAAGFETNGVHAIQRSEKLSSAVAYNLERIRTIHASIGSQRGTTQIAATPSVDQLEREMNLLRASAQPTPQTAPAAVIAEDVLAMAPKSDVLATLSDEDQQDPAPPTKRSIPRRSRIESTNADVSIIRATENDLLEATTAGRIQLAQMRQEGITTSEPQRRRKEFTTEFGNSPRRFVVPRSTGLRPDYNLYTRGMTPEDDPLQQLVDIDFKDMNLTNVVSLLAEMAQINVIAGTELEGRVTTELKSIPLGRAIEIVLRQSGLGIVEESGVYRITTYEEAVQARRETTMVFLQNAQAGEVKASLDDIIDNQRSGSGGDVNYVNIGANDSTNVVIITGPRDRVQELETVVAELDVADQVIPTVTVPIKLNYTDPAEMLPVVESLLSDDGKVAPDQRGRHIIVTDIPVKVEEIEAVIASIDIPVKQVSIDSMIVDALMEDGAETGVEWLLSSVHTISPGGTTIPEWATGAVLGDPADLASNLTFGIIGDSASLAASISAEIRNQNAELLANPTVVTVENQPAEINITTEFPYREETQTGAGGSLSSTKFKDIGTILKVTPKVTHLNDIIATVDVKESTVVGFTDTDIPIEAVRQAITTTRLNDGQTIYIGGLRSNKDNLTETKVPFLGDVPVLNTFFKATEVNVQNIELLVFLTCNVLPDQYPELTPYEKTRFDKLGGISMRPQGEKDLVNAYLHPERSRDPFYKWRRAK